ncbi:MAG: glycosyltransferase family 4 protein [Rhodospirillales bacterium]|nr:glycosyltransferase family 4 protein [Acetobacter sp.]
MTVLEPSAAACEQPVVSRQGATAVPRAKVLFLSMYHLGWKTWSHCIERYTPHCPGLDAHHIHVVQPFWMKLVNRRLPRPIGRSLVSPVRAWRWHVRRRFSRLIRAGGFDAVFVNSQILAPALIDLCRSAGTKLMVCTDVTGPAYVRDLLGQPDTARSWHEEQAIFSACSLIVPMSGWIAESLVHDFNVPRERIIVVPPVIEVSTNRRVTRKMPAAGSGLPRLLFCGNDWHRKGGPRLVQWHQKYWCDLAELHLVSKDADVRPGLRNVFNHGAVPNEQLLARILPTTDVFCLPTTCDMSPFAVTEAQAFGVPTVASKIGGMVNLVEHGKTGYLIPPHDDQGFVSAVSELLRNAELREVMGQAAAERARACLDAAVQIPHLLARIVHDALAA